MNPRKSTRWTSAIVDRTLCSSSSVFWNVVEIWIENKIRNVCAHNQLSLWIIWIRSDRLIVSRRCHREQIYRKFAWANLKILWIEYVFSHHIHLKCPSVSFLITVYCVVTMISILAILSFSVIYFAIRIVFFFHSRVVSKMENNRNNRIQNSKSRNIILLNILYCIQAIRTLWEYLLARIAFN